MPAHELDLGNGHRAEFTADSQGDFGGLIHYHPRPDGQGECAGSVTFRGRGTRGQPEWDVLSLDPLTLSPSILCRTCNVHGWIREGQWVDV